VIAPPNWDGGELKEAYVEEGTMVNSGPFTGLPSAQGKEAIADHLQQKGWGQRTISYRLRDWLISRQRYWGTPIPIIYCPTCGPTPVPEDQLPVLLAEDADFQPTGESPLARHDGFVRTACPHCGRPARRETDTMDTFVDSCWYYLRYLSPRDTSRPFDPELARQWAPVNQYTGGAEHAVMHLLYARFFTKVLRDLGLVDFGEPFTRLFNQGTIIAGHQKMSKSRGNVVTPDPYVEELGADVVRLYLMFVGPWEHGGDWSDAGINGVARWVNRVWDLCQRDAAQLVTTSWDAESSRQLRRATHRTVKKVLADVERFQFNTAIAALMEYTNALGRCWEQGDVDAASWRDGIEKLLLLLAPLAPHLSEELWERTGHAFSIHNQRLPQWDEALAREEEITLVVQVNGKVRDRLQVPAGVSEERAKELALASQNVQQFLQGKRVMKQVYVPGRLVNLVVG